MKRIRSWLGNIAQAYRLAKIHDRFVGLKMLAILAVGLALTFAGATVIGPFIIWYLLGPTTVLLVVAFYFGRTAETGAYTSVEGTPGAAAVILQSMRGAWFSTPGVAVNRQQDLVHRLVSRKGVMLISEGPASRVAPLLAGERKRTARYLPEDVTVLEVQTGREPGQVPIPTLARYLRKAPKVLKASEVTELRRRLAALGNAAQTMPMPKGPMPRNAKAARAMMRR